MPLIKKGLNKWQGFTLIELLVVVAIIGVLASVVLASLNSARAKTRDSHRIQTVKQIRNALALYYLDNGNYPNYTDNECGGTEGYTTTNNNFMNSLVVAGFLPTFPKDAGNVNCNLQYAPYNGNQSYIIFYHLETQSPPSTQTCYDPAYWFCVTS